MKIGNREKLLLVILGVMLYSFVFYKFVWAGTLPEINDKKEEIASSSAQKKVLDKQLENLPNTKAELKTKTNNDEHIQEYLAASQNLLDGIDYIQKLAALLGKAITEITVDKPVSAETGKKQKYFELNITFTTVLSFEEIQNLIDYIEGGTKKARVISFKMIPVYKSGNAPDNQKFEAAMSVKLYSLSDENMNKLYEYSRHKFSNYLENTGVQITPNINLSAGTEKNSTATSGKSMDSEADIALNDVKTGDEDSLENDVISCSSVMDSDIAIFEKAFFYPGDNLQIHGIKRPAELMGIKTKSLKNVNVDFADSKYVISIKNDSNDTKSISGKLKGKNFIRMYLQADFYTYVKENKNLGMNVAIKNNSTKKVYITLSDEPGRIKITDRIGNLIVQGNNDEKVFIV